MGISVDLARVVAAHLCTQPIFVEYDRAGDVAASALEDAWDLCFLAVDPQRAETIDFTQPYIRIEGSYLIRTHGLASTPEEVVERGLRIGSVRGSAYSLHLARQPGAEHLILFPSMADAVAALDTGDVDGLAGIRKAMDEISGLRCDAQVLHQPFMEIRQAMGLPKGRTRAHAHLCKLLTKLAQDGVISSILESNGVGGNSAIISAP